MTQPDIDIDIHCTDFVICFILSMFKSRMSKKNLEYTYWFVKLCDSSQKDDLGKEEAEYKILVDCITITLQVPEETRIYCHCFIFYSLCSQKAVFSTA